MVDVRRFPASRRQPWFNAVPLAASLEAANRRSGRVPIGWRRQRRVVHGQLSYALRPCDLGTCDCFVSGSCEVWCARQDSNLRPLASEAGGAPSRGPHSGANQRTFACLPRSPPTTRYAHDPAESHTTRGAHRPQAARCSGPIDSAGYLVLRCARRELGAPGDGLYRPRAVVNRRLGSRPSSSRVTPSFTAVLAVSTASSRLPAARAPTHRIVRH